jgi:HD superfamily phosphodiesterase
VLDSKLLSKENAGGAEAALVDALGSAMEGENKFLSKSEIDSIIFIVKNIGYRKLLDKEWDVSKQSVELRCVQDADLLDAIGGTGIARCFAFGGKRNRQLFELGPSIIGNIEMTQEAYAKSTGSGLEHFFEKLLRIPSMMSTTKGQEIAIQRKLAMVSWIESIREELNESTDNDDHGKIITRNLEPFLTALPVDHHAASTRLQS